MTIRSDLEDLERRGLVLRSHGGARIAEEFPILRILADTLKESQREKEKIAELAVSLIKPRMSIIIDSGSTTAYLSRKIKGAGFEELTVIGNSSRYFFDQINADIVFIGAG